MNDWHELTESDADALAPYVLHCADLSGEACQVIRRDFTAALAGSLRATIEAIGRGPEKGEIDIIRRALTAHFNDHVIPVRIANERPDKLH